MINSKFTCVLGPRLRKLKKAYINALSPQSANKYLPIQLAESTQLLQDMVHDPDVSPFPHYTLAPSDTF